MEISESARALLADSIVWDDHSGFMPDPVADLGNLEIWRQAGVTYLSIDVGFDLLPWTQAVKTLAAFRKWLGDHRDHYSLVTNTAGITAAKRDGKLAVTFDLEGMNALDGRIEMVEFYHHLGVRQILFAYNRNNLAGGGCHDDDKGLTVFGRQVIAEMNRLGLFVDISHCGYRTAMEVTEIMGDAGRPVIYSHSNPRALADHGRNITDDQIRACAATGGVIGINGVNLFLGDPTASSSTLADHIDYVIDIAGPAHVGLSLDYAFPVDCGDVEEILQANPDFWPPSAGYGAYPPAFAAPAQILEVTELLLRRGRPEQVIRDVLGGNFMRLAAEVWR